MWRELLLSCEVSEAVKVTMFLVSLFSEARGPELSNASSEEGEPSLAIQGDTVTISHIVAPTSVNSLFLE